MAPRLGMWSIRRMGALWGAGLLLEAALLLVMFALLVPPEPPLVAQLRGEDTGSGVVTVTALRSDEIGPGKSVEIRPGAVAPAAPEDSFYTVLHWPPDKPLLAGGGRVVAVPMRFWWVPTLYVGAVPLLLVGLTSAWLWARRRAPGADPAS